MTFGIGGAVFFSPIFIILFPLLGVPTLDPADAFGAALLTELVGFASGMISYTYRKQIDYKTALMLCGMGVPTAIMSTMIKEMIDGTILIFSFAIGMYLLSLFTLYHKTTSETIRNEKKAVYFNSNNNNSNNNNSSLIDDNNSTLHTHSSITENNYTQNSINDDIDDDESNPRSDSMYLEFGALHSYTKKLFSRALRDRKGNLYVYNVCRPIIGMILIMAGAFMTGLISVGIGESVVTVLRGKCKLPIQIASGTSVFVVAIVVLSSSVTQIISQGVSSIPWTLVMWTMPGVLIGGQIGPYCSQKVSSNTAEIMLIALFFVLGSVMVVEAFHAWGYIQY